MSTVLTLIKRNIKLFFKDKGMFFTSLVTPAILLVLYATFLANVYRDSFTSGLPTGLALSDKVIDGLVGSQLVSSILAVSCITVAFCSNFLMVQDKANGVIKDFLISPVKPSHLSLGYYIATMISTLLICLTATTVCLLYLIFVGWYLTFSDVLLIILDVFILVSFGTALSSVINHFLSTQGQISAVSAIISAGYGFICGAYMPISSFGNGLQKAVAFLPGTYGTSLLRNHTMNGALKEMTSQGVPSAVIDGLKDLLDCNIYFFETKVSISAEYLILCLSTLVLIAIYILLTAKKKKNK